MKLFAWKYHKYMTERDARFGLYPVQLPRAETGLLYEKYMDIAIADDFNEITSAARVLGDIAEVLIGNSTALNQVRPSFSEN